MDRELLLTLLVFWSSTTAALIIFLRLWFANRGEAFHPHSVEVAPRHQHFLCVHAQTQCKRGFVVSSISAFVAPRGSTSNKSFTVLGCCISVTGFIGSMQWYGTGDATFFELICCLLGFIGLLFVCITELDVTPERFLTTKLLVTSWLAQRVMAYRLRAQKRESPPAKSLPDLVVWLIWGSDFREVLPFPIDETDKGFCDFITSNPNTAEYFVKDLTIHGTGVVQSPSERFAQRKKLVDHDGLVKEFERGNAIGQLMHAVGCVVYIGLCTYAVVLNDPGESPRLASVVLFTFFSFGFTQFLTGMYGPVPYLLKGWIMPWNPFYEDRGFMADLDAALADAETMAIDAGSNGTTADAAVKEDGASSGLRKRKVERESSQAKEKFHLTDANIALDNPFLRWASVNPISNIDSVGHFMVMTEMIAVLTPCVAIGLQWITALCDGPVLVVIWDLFIGFLSCGGHGVLSGTFRDCAIFNSDIYSHCIFKAREVCLA
uniref:Uncharacterized protein n=1 Tax=Pinguiococcus pyrenoidosus TaxID=172671 RepID=A0A7R9UCB2_9STRA|mmetsp:Transcript_3577/g.14094  ORF Transcript_3577/g.14094 Transcript_3577/m.14094 type:complete len:490 (+) Transcript_3577:110-1579(+)